MGVQGVGLTSIRWVASLMGFINHWAQSGLRRPNESSLRITWPGGFKKVKLSIQYDPYYKEIWGNLLAVSYPLHTVIVI